MINLKVNDADRILIIEMKGMISEADIDAAIDALQAQYPAVGVHLRGGERGGFSMLVDWQDLEGWEKGAKTLGTLTTKTIGDAVRKIAVIAGAPFADEQPRLSDVAKRAEVRFFAPGRGEDALAWLRSR
jgi:SpoIIAA-like